MIKGLSEMRKKHSEIKVKVASLELDFLRALRRVMRIPSVKGIEEHGAPFGLYPKQALLEALEIGCELGFETKLVNNAMGYVQYGVDEEYVGVVGHLDVVAAGSGWTHDPFDLTIVDQIAYGRGVLDNKGPVMSTLFALYALKELQIPLSRSIRIIFGSDEESGSADIPLYLAEEAAPVYGFTPDCKYPAVYGERGIVGVEIRTIFAEGELEEILSVSGNFDPSAIPDSLTLILASGQIQARGKRAPSNAPALGVNAITLLGQLVSSDQLSEPSLLAYFHWLGTLHDQHDGKSLGIDFADQESGRLQLSPVSLMKQGPELVLSLSIRYPISVTEEQLLKQLEGQLPAASYLRVTRSMPSAVFPKNHPMLQVMQEVYEQIRGEDGTPVTTTGATYARRMPNIVAFGPSFPGQKGIAHNKDEYMSVADLMSNMEIYALTLAELAK